MKRYALLFLLACSAPAALAEQQTAADLAAAIGPVSISQRLPATAKVRQAAAALLGNGLNEERDDAEVRFKAPGWAAGSLQSRQEQISTLLQEPGVHVTVSAASYAPAAAPQSAAAIAPLRTEATLALVSPELLGERAATVFDGSLYSGSGALTPAPGNMTPGRSGLLKPAPKPLLFDPADMDTKVNPCVDFYEYSCGSWLRNTPIPSDETSWYRFSQIDKHTEEVLRDILEQAAATSVDPKTGRIGDLYAACMDTQAVEAQGLAPLKPELSGVATLASLKDLPAELGRLKRAGMGLLFSFGPAQDYKDAARMVASLDQGGLSMPNRDYYLKPEFASERAAFLKHVAKMFRLSGDSPAAAAAAAKDVMALETALARISMDEVSRRDPLQTHHMMALGTLAKTMPSFSWEKYLEAAAVPGFKSLDVASPKFFSGLQILLKTVPLKTWKSYLRWHVLSSNAEYLPAAFVEEDFRFYGQKLSGQKELEPRWKRCVGLVDSELGDALGQAYVEREFGPEKAKLASQMVQQIKQSMKEDIAASPWMSPQTKQKAQAKLAAVVDKIGYPAKWKDYGELSVSRRDLLADVRASGAFEERRQFSQIGKPVDRGEWGMTPPTDNAYYDPQLNDINFPAGTLQPPLFDPRAGMAENYGATGSVMGHELTHAFDDEGRQYDGQGNLNDWWTPQDAAAFEARSQGMADQYSKYVCAEDPAHPGKPIKLNGKLTLGENLADNGGLRLAYMAFRRAQAARPEPVAQGFTAEQRFFLSFGQSWCGKQTPESAREQATTDPHSPPRYRVNGTVSNMPEFRQAFSCAAGSPMVQKSVNRVW